MKEVKLKLWHKIVFSLIVIVILSLFFAPRIANSYLNKHSKDLVGRKIEIQKIRINYFNGSVKIYKLSVFESDESAVFLSFDKLLVNLDYWPLLRNELSISKILLTNLNCHVIQKGEEFNFTDLLQADEKELIDSSQVETVEDTESMVISLNNIVLSRSNLTYTDVLLNHAIKLDDVDLFIPGFTLNTGASVLDLDFELSQGGSFNSKLHLDQDQGSFTLDLQLDSLNIDVIEPYIKENITISDVNGYFSNEIVVKGNTQHLSQLEVSGVNKIDGFMMSDTDGRTVLSFEELKVAVKTFQLISNQLHLSEITLVKPEVLFELFDSTNNWLTMMVGEELSEVDSITIDTVKESTGKSFTYALDHLSLQGGKVFFADKNLDNDFESLIHDIQVVSKNVSATSGEVDFSISAEINQTGIFKSDIVVDMSMMDDFELDFSLIKFDMKDVEPYMLHYFGYTVEEGLMNFSSSNVMKNSSIISTNELYLRKFELDKVNRSEARIKLPLRLALGILSDNEGVIDVDIPVESSDEETSIGNLGKIIAKSIGNLFVKAATSPADLLGLFYNYDPQKLKVISMGLFETFPDSEELKTLDIIAQILTDKPQLRVKMYHRLEQEAFFDSLAYKTVMEDWGMEEGNMGLNVSDSALKKYIITEKSALKLDTSMSMQELSAFYCDTVYLRTRYDSIKMQQVDFISDYLIEHKEISADKLEITEFTSDTLSGQDTETLFFIEFLSEASLNE